MASDIKSVSIRSHTVFDTTSPVHSLFQDLRAVS